MNDRTRKMLVRPNRTEPISPNQNRIRTEPIIFRKSTYFFFYHNFLVVEVNMCEVFLQNRILAAFLGSNLFLSLVKMSPAVLNNRSTSTLAWQDSGSVSPNRTVKFGRTEFFTEPPGSVGSVLFGSVLVVH